ncbi:MAG: PstS family phosphate ABC transporter substrate-binding protein [Actinobacteria bacterium]|nr:MAG: PstS family phosphate ABC transporter substrate-binding protein [Actinomycetota bacterium]
MKKVYVCLALLAVVLVGCKGGGSTSKAIQIQGSDTMVNLAQAWAQEYMAQNSDADVRVDGGGSSVGIQSLIKGTTDIANASRQMKSEEVGDAKAKGFTPKETIVGYDGIVVAVNKNNSVEKLTIDQLADIFSGKTTNWKAVGGADGKIVLLSRESSSGTYEFFKEHVLNNGDSKGTVNFAASASLLNNSSQIVDQVAGNKNAVGYFGMGYSTPNIKEVSIAKDTNSPYIKPTVDTVKSKEYTISRSLQIYTHSDANGVIKKYIDFILGEKGQEIVEKSGFVPLN